jgi:di/tripeptidase
MVDKVLGRISSHAVTSPYCCAAERAQQTHPDEASTPADQVAVRAESPVDVERVKKLFLELCQIPGPSFDERKVADTIKQKLADLGYQAREDDAGKKIGGNTGNLLVDVPGTVMDAPPLIFLCHMDTVPLAVGDKPHIKDGVIYSDGRHALGGDDRAGNAEMLEMLRLLKEKNIPHPPMQIIFTVAEEAGLLGSQALDPKDVHGKLGFEADFFHPNEILWGVEWGPDGPVPGDKPHPRNPAEQFLEDFTKQSIRDIGLTPKKWEMDDASSDSASIRGMGIPAIIIGAGEQDVHTRHEHIAVNDLAKATELLLQIIANANKYKLDADGNIVARTELRPATAADQPWLMAGERAA